MALPMFQSKRLRIFIFPGSDAGLSGDNQRERMNWPMKITVNGYSGHRLNERPCRFVLDGHPYQVEEILDQWYGPDSAYFKVRASDGNLYILRYHTHSDEWTLESFRHKGAGTETPGRIRSGPRQGNPPGTKTL